MLFRLDSTENAMRKTSIFTLAFLSAIMIPAIQQVHAAVQTIDGVVSDTMCGKKHMLAGKTAAECIQTCVKDGSSYAIVAGDKVYTLAGKPQAIAPFAGKHVHIKGDLKNNILTVTSIHEATAEMRHDMPM
jgi:hypothetical protein